jgi:pilus assembly protein CpaC
MATNSEISLQVGFQRRKRSRNRLRVAGLLSLLGVVVVSGSSHARADVIELSAQQGVVRLGAARSESQMQYRMTLESGKSASIKTSFKVKRVSVGDPDVLEVVVLGNYTLQLVSKVVGATNLLIWDSEGRPQAVVDVQVGTAHSQLERSLRETFANDSLQVSSAGSAVILKGSVPSSVVLDQVLSLTDALLGENDQNGNSPQVVNLLEVGGNHQVLLKVVVAEMSRTLNREFGTNFAALIETGSGQVTIGSFVGGIAQPAGGAGSLASSMANLFGGFKGFGGLEMLEVFLDVLDERGLSKILAKPRLLARSGETASFLVGGQIPIPVAQGGAFGSITVEYKDFGVGLSFTPTVLGPNRIHLEVNPEVSRADFSFGMEVNGANVPAFLTRRVNTSVELADGQSFMIAGLLSDQVRELAGKYPLLGDIPILGALFRSTQFQKEETELVIIVTPVLVNPMAPGHHTLPTDNFIEPNDLEFYLLGAMEGNPNRHPDHQDNDAGEPEMIGTTGPRVSTSYDGEKL